MKEKEIQSQRVAIGTNLAAASVMGISGLIGHFINHNIDYLVLMIMGSAAILGGYIGARYMIGLVLIVVAITMFFRVFQITTHTQTGL